MITKEQKVQQIKESKERLGRTKLLIFADFEGSGVGELRELRQSLKLLESKFQVLKKRLLKIALKQEGINFDPLKFEKQVGVVWSNHGIEEVAPSVYKFAQAHEGFRILGGLDVNKKEEIPLEQIVAIGSLPSREVLLAQLLGMMTAPLRGLMHIMNERSKAQ